MPPDTGPRTASAPVLLSGETLIDFIPETAGPLSTVESFHRRAGGAPANVAVALARLDRTPWFCSSIATDRFGEFLQATLDEAGLPERFIRRDDDHETALAFVEHGEAGDRSFSFYREDTADLYLEPVRIPDDVLADIDVVGIGGVALTAEPSRSATLAVLDRANQHDCTVVFDPNARPELWTRSVDGAATMRRALERTDVCKVSGEDLAAPALAWTDRPADLLDAGPHTVVVTEGEAGARAVSQDAGPWGGGEWHHPGYAVEVVDATGAGDAFTAGLIAGLLEGDGPVAVLARANAVAAAATTAAGAMAALPDSAAVERLMDTDGGD